MNESQRKNWIQVLGRYFVEIVIIFIGITISFMFDKWRESKSARQQETEFIESLLVDLKFKKDEIQHELLIAKEFISYADSVFKGESLSSSSINFLLASYDTDNNFFSSSTPSFNLNSTSERYYQLPDSLRRKLFEVYSFFEFVRLTFDKVSLARYEFKKFMALEKIVTALDSKQMDGRILKGDSGRIRQFVISASFINNLRLIRNYEMQKQRIMSEVDKDVEKVMTNLTAYKAQLAN